MAPVPPKQRARRNTSDAAINKGRENDHSREGTPASESQRSGRGRPSKLPNEESPRSTRPPGPGPSKRRKLQREGSIQSQPQKPQAESFIMKLFDRSVDLSMFNGKTPLYPICRAWAQNQARNPNMENAKVQSPPAGAREDNGEEVLAKLKSGELKNLELLPKPKPETMSRILTIKSEEADIAKVIDEGIAKGATQEELLDSNHRRWKTARRQWIEHTKNYYKRYEIVEAVLKELIK